MKMLKIVLVKTFQRMKRWDCSLDVTRDMRTNGLKQYDNNLIKLIKSRLPNKWGDEKKKERQVTYHEYGKHWHYKTDCPSLVTHKGKTIILQDEGKKTPRVVDHT